MMLKHTEQKREDEGKLRDRPNDSVMPNSHRPLQENNPYGPNRTRRYHREYELRQPRYRAIKYQRWSTLKYPEQNSANKSGHRHDGKKIQRFSDCVTEDDTIATPKHPSHCN